MMSSATSTNQVRLEPDTTPPEVRAAAGAALDADRSGFRPAHFFVLAALVAATAAVILSRQSTPEHLVFMSLTIASAGLAAAGFYRMMSPLVGASSIIGSEGLSERGRAVLAREKLLVLRALKDLEFDRSMGKVSAVDFEEMAGRLRTRAISLMKQLDEDGTGYRTIIERELSARLAGRAAGRTTAQAAKVTPAADAALPGHCACGTANDADALFCKRCGTALTQTSEASTLRR
jgi:hypothetical protein